MGDFGCGSGGWTPVMKTDGTKVKDGGEICWAIFIKSEKMVLLYFFVNFSNLLPMYFLIFAFPLRRIVISTAIDDILRESSELYNFITKAFNIWLSFSENLPLWLWFLERQERLQPCRRDDWFWQSRNQIALLLGDTLLKDLSRNEDWLNNKIRGHWPKRRFIVCTYRWRNIPSFVSGP